MAGSWAEQSAVYWDASAADSLADYLVAVLAGK